MFPGGSSCFFFFNDTATTEIYTLSLHDALPILSAAYEDPTVVGATGRIRRPPRAGVVAEPGSRLRWLILGGDRKSTRLNSSHSQISYAVFCLKKKKYDNTQSGRRTINALLCHC